MSFARGSDPPHLGRDTLSPHQPESRRWRQADRAPSIWCRDSACSIKLNSIDHLSLKIRRGSPWSEPVDKRDIVVLAAEGSRRSRSDPAVLQVESVSRRPGPIPTCPRRTRALCRPPRPVSRLSAQGSGPAEHRSESSSSAATFPNWWRGRLTLLDWHFPSGPNPTSRKVDKRRSGASAASRTALVRLGTRTKDH